MAMITLRLTRRQIEALIQNAPAAGMTDIANEADAALRRYKERLAVARYMVEAAHEERENK